MLHTSPPSSESGATHVETALIIFLIGVVIALGANASTMISTQINDLFIRLGGAL